MFLKLKNIGMIKTADIEIDGITVIAGENNTGKSTVSKALFSVFNSFYQTDEQIATERLDTISGIISSACRYVDRGFLPRFETDVIADEIIKNKDKYINDVNLLHSELNSMLIQSYKIIKNDVEKIDIKGVSDKIIQVFNVSDYEILVTVIQKMLQSEFSDQIVNLNGLKKNGEITLLIKNKKVKITISPNEDAAIDIEGKLNLNTEAVYIDDPFIIDSVRTMPRYRPQYTEHKEHLISKLRKGTFNTGEGNHISRSPIDHILVSKKLEDVYEKLNMVCSGEFVRKNRSIAYKESKSGNVFEMTNISTGLKTFVILKILLLNGSIEENGTIILDEPESHLHPEWQLVFAELIVLLQKEFNLHILINTHSPYFVNALEVHSHKYGVSSRCRYYLAANTGKSSVISDVSNSIELIYEKLARPLQDLENMRYSND